MLTFHGPPERVQCLTFVPGPDGPAVAAGYRGAVHVWPLAGGEPAVLSAGTPEDLRGTTGLSDLAASPDGDWLAGRRYGGNRLWWRRGGRWVEAGRLVGNPPPWATFQGPDLVYTLGRWDEPEGRWVYEVIRGRPSDAGPPVQSHAAVRTRPPPADTYKGRGHACANLAELAPDGRTLATSAGEKAVQLWDATT